MTLTQTAILTKQVITISIIAILLGIVSFTGYKIWYAHYLSTLPPVEEKPDTKFGVLPLPIFPNTSVSSSNFSYSLDTATGGLPKVGIDPGFERLVKVYFVIKPYATFLSADKSQSLAEKFGIKNPPEVINETTYRFKQDNKTLIIDLDSGNFKYTNEATSAALEKLDENDKLVTDFENTLNLLGVLKPELKEGRNKVSLLKIEGDKFVTTENRNEASSAIVSLWPRALDKKQVFTKDFNKALVNAIVINSASSLDNYLSLNFTFFQVDENTFATYPTKTSDEAFEQLKTGKGIVVVVPQKPQVSITSVSSGYFLEENYSPYIQPIFIFEGPSFMAFVPAVSNQFLK